VAESPASREGSRSAPSRTAAWSAVRPGHHQAAGIPTLAHHRPHRQGAAFTLRCRAGTPTPHGPAARLLDGLPPRPLRGQGSLRAHECSLGRRPPLDRFGPEAARRHRSPGAGEDHGPTSRRRRPR
jgi:hypothetical protein